VGVHPDYLSDQPVGAAPLEEPTVERLVALASHPKVVAMGETGLDYFRLKEPLDWQRERFRTHIRAARITGKPLIVHTRAAADDTIRLMRKEGADQCGGVMHCFTESWETASAALDLGFYISFSGILTFKSAAEIREVARRVPMDRVLIETDSPYLAPVPHRGKVNQPCLVGHVADVLASVLGADRATVEKATSDNFFRLFNCL
jgi:TatD DNase family protein